MHAFTKNPEKITREADIVISAAGVVNLVRGHWLKPGAIVIDVGTNPVEVKTRKALRKLKYLSMKISMLKSLWLIKMCACMHAI